MLAEMRGSRFPSRAKVVAFGLDCLPVVSGAKHEIRHVVIQDRLFALGIVQRIQEGEPFVVLLPQRAHCFTIGRIGAGLGSGQAGREYAAASLISSIFSKPFWLRVEATRANAAFRWASFNSSNANHLLHGPKLHILTHKQFNGVR